MSNRKTYAVCAERLLVCTTSLVVYGSDLLSLGIRNSLEETGTTGQLQCCYDENFRQERCWGFIPLARGGIREGGAQFQGKDLTGAIVLNMLHTCTCMFSVTSEFAAW